MIFFILLVVLTAAAAAVQGARSWPARMRLAMALALFLVGSDHWVNPQRYLPMMPPWIPLHLELILFTGAAEIAGGIGLLVPRLRRLAGAMLALYFVAVFPANLHNALNGLVVEGLPHAPWYYRLRLAFQPLAVWWALYSAELIGWPFESFSSARRDCVRCAALSPSAYRRA